VIFARGNSKSVEGLTCNARSVSLYHHLLWQMCLFPMLFLVSWMQVETFVRRI